MNRNIGSVTSETPYYWFLNYSKFLGDNLNCICALNVNKKSILNIESNQRIKNIYF